MKELWVVQRYEGIEDISESCRQLFERSGRENVFLSLEWFRNFIATVVQKEDRVRIYAVGRESDSNHVMGAVVLWLQPRKAGFLSPYILQGLSNYYTAYFGPVWQGKEEDIDEFAAALVGALLEDRREWEVLDLRPLDPESPIFQGLLKALRRKGIPTQTHSCFGNWYLPVKGTTFDQYVEGLSKVLRKNIPYQTRRLERSFRVEIKLSTGDESLESLLQDYEVVYNSSWRSGEAYPEFVRGLARLAARERWLRLSVLYADGVPIAAQFWMVQGGVGAIYKVCYDERYAKYSVGTVLTAYMMRRAIEIDKVELIDYLSGDDVYKKDWMSHRRERWGILAFNPASVRGVCQAVVHIGGRLAKRQFARLRSIGFASPMLVSPKAERDNRTDSTAGDRKAHSSI